jgi:thiosulfate dehydrogenase [quinone] large subunit
MENDTMSNKQILTLWYTFLMSRIIIEEPAISKFMFADTKSSWFWLVVRLYVGWQWLTAAWEKISGGGWIGSNAGAQLTGFLQGALNKTSGSNPAVQGWYAWFLQHSILTHVVIWSNVVAIGELLVGIALILGLFTGIAAFFGLFMNLNYLLAGTVSINPILFTLSISLILAWRVAGWLGLDYFALPALGTPWKPGKLKLTLL